MKAALLEINPIIGQGISVNNEYRTVFQVHAVTLVYYGKYRTLHISIGSVQLSNKYHRKQFFAMLNCTSEREFMKQFMKRPEYVDGKARLKLHLVCFETDSLDFLRL